MGELLVAVVVVIAGVVAAVVRRRRRRSRATVPTIEPVAPRSLRVRGLQVRSGKALLIDDVSLDVAPGEIIGLVGPNGAGKSTVLAAVAGTVPASAGSISLDARSIDRRSPRWRARAGIGLDRGPALDGGDDDDRPGLRHIAGGHRRMSTPPAVTISAIVAALGLADALAQPLGALGPSRRRLVEVARALARRPSVVLLDEPFAGLSDADAGRLAALLRTAATNWGMGVLVAERDLEPMLGLCHRIVVLGPGQVVAAGPPAAVAVDPAVLATFLGDDASAERLGA